MNKKNAIPRFKIDRLGSKITMMKNLNIDNGLRGRKNDRQLVTAGMFYCRINVDFSVPY